ncbi:MAG: hypothetical protein PHV78_00490 [Patescibacteria group bacterium]|nr:hypothetical protein [Patescibacteria group bacterium]MDD5121350.1 hypothetical protein [Patescibacteria group bacterium]MDD5395731.1 hypothetical protein [Patescibacteria group bacterium]
MKQLFPALFVLVLFGLGFAQTPDSQKVFSLTICTSNAQNMSDDICMWYQVKGYDSACQDGRFQVDTNVNLMGNAWPQRGNPLSGVSVKYRRSPIDDSTTLASIQRHLSSYGSQMDSNDILVVQVIGHGCPPPEHLWQTVLWNNEVLTDSMLAAWCCAVPGYKFVAVWSCFAFGTGVDSLHQGIATWFGCKAPEAIRYKTVVVSAAGPQPAWSPGWADDYEYPGAPYTPGCENDVNYQLEFWTHLGTVLCGGIEPSWYRSTNGTPPGYWLTAIDTVNGRDLPGFNDSRLSVAKCSTWIRARNTRPGYEDYQIVDPGHLKDIFVLWPRPAIIDSIDAQPLELVVPDTVNLNVSFGININVKNHGIYPTVIPAELYVDSNRYLDTSSQVLPNHEALISFSSRSDSTTGWVRVRCVTQLSGDQSPHNDTLVDSIYILPTSILEEQANVLNHEAPLPTVIPFASFKRVFAQHKFVIFDVNGRRIQDPIEQGVFFLFDTDLEKTHKVIVVR